MPGSAPVLTHIEDSVPTLEPKLDIGHFFTGTDGTRAIPSQRAPSSAHGRLQLDASLLVWGEPQHGVTM
eukprot:CAMPEP_0174896794 /NCGR_PEP_ID=MMETSP0167-20121228/10911_1 /TAXON_ID=38298 /ORGANISM="Rhodella maculata, Strain CCMP736" /LENGTH=68 /DNA_ID=CAMNT_0016136457 /DNA_START=85 /DNA_END=288 /DNA_ORIENTATION=-